MPVLRHLADAARLFRTGSVDDAHAWHPAHSTQSTHSTHTMHRLPEWVMLALAVMGLSVAALWTATVWQCLWAQCAPPPEPEPDTSAC